ncbi:hypothetical protein [Lentzea sp. NPDC004782]|uniref:hypothetical protein n=1 Tax=Lentzea sp. NPDC004782 TaxID=3154458 RepID=UPI0033ABC29E
MRYVAGLALVGDQLQTADHPQHGEPCCCASGLGASFFENPPDMRGSTTEPVPPSLTTAAFEYPLGDERE